MTRRSTKAREAEQAVRKTWVKQRREARSAVVPRLLQARAGVQLDISVHNLLVALAEAGPSTISELARVLGTDLSTVSRQVLQPEAAGLVGRMPSTAGRSGQLIHLTADGAALVDRLLGAWKQLLDPVLAAWTDEEVVSFSTLLQRFVDDFQHEVHTQVAGAER